MPGLFSVKTPPNATPLRVLIAATENGAGGTRRPPSPSPSVSRTKPTKKTPDKSGIDEYSLENPDLGPFLLKLARDTIASGDNPNKALDYAIRASKSFERCSGPGLELAMSLLLGVGPTMWETHNFCHILLPLFGFVKSHLWGAFNG
ncbi:hypothetical protein V6Z11_A07G158200 [Gossypium hirsutum]